MAVTGILVVSAAAVATMALFVRNVRAGSKREQHIRAYMFPRGLFQKFAAARPGLDVKHQQLVARALRQYFLAYLKSGCKRVAMPSQVVDELWHEFILFTRDYAQFCQAAFGRFLHHTPAVKLGTARADNDGLRRVWWYCCLEENINPRRPTRLPLLFALDRKLGIANGFVYQLDCGRTPVEVRDGASAGIQCATHFNDAHYDDAVDGFGGISDHGGHRGEHHDIRGDDPGGYGDLGSHHSDSSDSGCSGGCSGGCGGD